MNTYDIMAQAIDYLVALQEEAPPTLEQISSQFHSAPTVFQKNFQNFVGLSPKQLQRYMSMRHARELLLEGYPTLEAAYDAGLSGNGRLHDLCVTIDAATPGEVKSRGQGVRITYGWAETIFGVVLIGQTARGICWLSFELDGEREPSEAIMRRRFAQAEFVEDQEAARRVAENINHLLHPEREFQGQAKQGGHNSIVSPMGPERKIKLNLFGTNFQLKVWEALLKIPSGGSVSYGCIADHVCTKKASRAVGTAVGANPVSFIIPCHRVIQQSGIIENYAWGSARKKVLLSIEREKMRR